MPTATKKRPTSKKSTARKPTEEQIAERTAEVTTLKEQLVTSFTDLVTSEDWTTYLGHAAQLRNYSANNVMLIRWQCPHATRVASFSGWKALGRSVRKGEKSIRILRPLRAPIRRADGLEDEDDRQWRVIGFRPGGVFDISQTEGDLIGQPFIELLEGEAPEGVWDHLVSVAATNGWRVERDFTDDGMSRRLIEGRRLIVSPNLSEAGAVKALVHELAHVRQLDEGHDVGAERREVEAESVAYIVCNALGITSAPFSIGYVAGWSGGDVSVVQACATWAVGAARAILDEIESLGALDAPVELADLGELDELTSVRMP